MRELHPIESLRAKRQNRLDEQVDRLATRVAKVMASSSNFEMTDQHEITIKRPRWVTPSVFADQLQTGILKNLAEVGVEDVVEYDAEATRLASTEYDEYGSEGGSSDWNVITKPEITLVFIKK